MLLIIFPITSFTVSDFAYTNIKYDYEPNIIKTIDGICLENQDTDNAIRYVNEVYPSGIIKYTMPQESFVLINKFYITSNIMLGGENNNTILYCISNTNEVFNIASNLTIQNAYIIINGKSFKLNENASLSLNSMSIACAAKTEDSIVVANSLSNLFANNIQIQLNSPFFISSNASTIALNGVNVSGGGIISSVSSIVEVHGITNSNAQVGIRSSSDTLLTNNNSSYNGLKYAYDISDIKNISITSNVYVNCSYVAYAHTKEDYEKLYTAIESGDNAYISIIIDYPKKNPMILVSIISVSVFFVVIICIWVAIACFTIRKRHNERCINKSLSSA